MQFDVVRARHPDVITGQCRVLGVSKRAYGNNRSDEKTSHLGEILFQFRAFANTGRIECR